jgi:hypothetical protein
MKIYVMVYEHVASTDGVKELPDHQKMSIIITTKPLLQKSVIQQIQTKTIIVMVTEYAAMLDVVME